MRLRLLIRPGAVLGAMTMIAACAAEAPDDAAPAGKAPAGAVGPAKPNADPEGDEPVASESPTPEPEPTLPNGSTSVFPEHRLVGFSGGRAESFGRLEAADLEGAAAELDELIPEYERDGRTVLPVYELITVIAHSSPTDNGLYRTVEPDEVIEQYLDAARAHGAILLLNVQPGRSDFLDDVKSLERWLLEPDVGLALDPEWAVGADEVPGRTYGSTTGAELDSVAEYVSDLVAENGLPEKILVFHQVHPSVVEDEDDLGEHAGVALVKSVDGIGAPEDKEETWDRLMPTKPDHVGAGFKLFFDEDTRHGPLMTPEQVLELEPLPEYVLYE